jgi:tRNA dimethylallyltransferase
VNGRSPDPDAPAQQVIALFGPTSVGKSELAVVLSERLASVDRGSVLVAADSMQLYRGLELVSGAASSEQRARADHRLLGCIPINEEFSVGQYSELAHAEIDAALARGDQPLVVGGTGLYLQAALTEMPLRPPVAAATEAALQLRLEREGADVLHQQLARHSPSAAERINVADHRRLIRALALIEEGHTVDDQQGGIWSSQMRHPTRLIGLVRSREALNERINARVDEIAAGGGAAEVANAVGAGASRTARMALGFRELQSGDLDAMKQATRRYAKRQLTWLKKLESAELFDLDNRRLDDAADEILAALNRPAA